MLNCNFRRLFVGGLVWLAAGIGQAAPNGDPYTLVVNEGATTVTGRAVLEKRYAGLAQLMGSITKRKVEVDPYVDVGLFTGRVRSTPPEFIFAKTIDVAASLVLDGTYLPLAKADSPYVAGFIASHLSDVSRLDGLKGHVVLFPPADTFTARLGMAMLRHEGMSVKQFDDLPPGAGKVPSGSVTVRHIRYQEAILSTVRDLPVAYPVGVVNPTMLDRWQREGLGGVVARTPPMPGWTLLVHTRLPAPEREVLRTALLRLNRDEPAGDAALRPIGVNRLVEAKQQEYAAVLQYLGE